MVCIPAWFVEGEATDVQIWVKQFCYLVIDQFYGNFLLDWLAKEKWVWVLIDQLDLDTDSQNDHRHNKSVEDTSFMLRLAVELFLPVSLDLSDRDEELLSVVHVKWKLVELTKHVPVG